MTLKPCPFCGVAPALETVRREGVKLPGFAIRCINGFCEVRPQLGPHWNMQSAAIRLWNERHRTPQP